MNNYVEQSAATGLTLKELGAVDEPRAELLAFAADGELWAAAWGSGIRLFRGDKEVSTHQRQHVAGGRMAFTPDGGALQLGLGEADITSGDWRPQPAVGDVAAWITGKGLPAPPKLSFQAASKSPDGTMIAASATGVTRDRQHGLQRPATGSVNWLLVLDGTSRQPSEVLWHGDGDYNQLAFSADHLVAGGMGGLRVFRRADFAASHDLSSQLRGVIAVAWSPDGALLAAIGQQKQINIWRTGSWDAPVASWSVGSDYASALAFHPTRPVLLLGNRDGHVRAYSVASADLAAPTMIADQEVGGNVRGFATTTDGAALLVAVGPPAGKVIRFGLAVAP